LKQVNWDESLNEWLPSVGAIPMTDDNRIAQVATFCKYVGENCFGRIEYFDDPLASKKQVEEDGISKCEVFEIAAKQLLEHKKLWEVVQSKYPDRLTFEFPLAIPDGERMRYLKFQISEGVKGLTSPSKVRKVYLRYHISDQQIEVRYED